MELLIVGIIGYVGVLIRDIPKKIFEVMLTNISSSITVTSKNNERYAKLNRYLYKLNKKSMIYNSEISDKRINGRNDSEASVNYGNYLFRLDKKTFCYLVKELKDTTWDVSSVIHLKIFGKNRKKFIEEIKREVSQNSNKGVRVFSSPDPYDQGRIVPKKTFNQIYFEGKDRLINAIENWQQNEDIYKSRGIVYKLGILLYGEPGCGKSSIAKAIADKMGYDIYYLNLKGFKDYTSLVNKIEAIPLNSVVLLEDIDCILKDREIEQEQQEVLNTALNFLDGAISPNNCIMIATTNYIDRLDEAFKREGRFDVKIEMKKLNKELAKAMCNDYGVTLEEIGVSTPINPSKLQNELMKYTMK